jgi:hypothetical protein
MLITQVPPSRFARMTLLVAFAFHDNFGGRGVFLGFAVHG